MKLSPQRCLAGLSVLLLLCKPAFAARLDAASEASLAAGEVILVDHAPTHPGAVSVEGVAEVKASPEALWHSLLDFEARLQGNSAVKSFRHYKPSTATEQWGAWEASHFGFNVVYFNHYRIDRAAGVLIHELDPSQANTLQWSRGVYKLGPSPNNPAWLRLSYAVETDFGVAIPSFIKVWLAGQGVRDYLSELVHRAEAFR
jgi:hypothetical protein